MTEERQDPIENAKDGEVEEQTEPTEERESDEQPAEPEAPPEDDAGPDLAVPPAESAEPPPPETQTEAEPDIDTEAAPQAEDELGAAEPPGPEPAAPAPEEKAAEGAPSPAKRRVVLRSWPRTLFMYPTLVFSLVFALLSVLLIRPGSELRRAEDGLQDAIAILDKQDAEEKAPETEPVKKALDRMKASAGELREAAAGPPILATTLALVFLAVIGSNLCATAFDIRRKGGILLAVVVLALLGACLWLSTYGKGAGIAWLMRPMANAQFYLFVAFVLFLLIVIPAIREHFRRWTCNESEIVVRTGVLRGKHRFPIRSVVMTEEPGNAIPLFLLKTARFTLTHPGINLPLTLENVINPDKKAAELSHFLGMNIVSKDRG